MKKTLITILATVLVCAMVVGGTLAWLTAKSETITNTFTVGNVTISLTETTGNEYKMVPGSTIDKNPKVTVAKNSENCYVFVKIEETNNVANSTSDTKFVEYTLADGWTVLDSITGVYYRVYTTSEDSISYNVFSNDKVSVSSNLTADQLAVARNANPQISITAYAIQSENIEDASTAWNQVSTAYTTTGDSTT